MYHFPQLFKYWRKSTKMSTAVLPFGRSGIWARPVANAFVLGCRWSLNLLGRSKIELNLGRIYIRGRVIIQS
jgi:hypothetical protein